jgi:hypothetical protein
LIVATKLVDLDQGAAALAPIGVPVRRGKHHRGRPRTLLDIGWPESCKFRTVGCERIIPSRTRPNRGQPLQALHG